LEKTCTQKRRKKKRKRRHPEIAMQDTQCAHSFGETDGGKGGARKSVLLRKIGGWNKDTELSVKHHPHDLNQV